MEIEEDQSGFSSQGKTYATRTLPGKGMAQTRDNKLRKKKACLKNILKAVKMLSLVSSAHGSRKSGMKVLFTPIGPARFTCVEGMILDGPSGIRHQHGTVFVCGGSVVILAEVEALSCFLTSGKGMRWF